MNANLRKEIVIILPGVAACAVLMLMAPFTQSLRSVSIIAFCVGCVLVGVRPFCAEFQHRTMTLLFVQPVPRSEIWRVKRWVQLLGFIVLVATLFFVPIIAQRDFEAAYQDILRNAGGAMPFLLVLPLAYLTGPFWALMVRGTIAASVFGVIGPLLVPLPFLVWSEHSRPIGSDPGDVSVGTYLSIFCYALACWSFSRSYFSRMQVADSTGGEIDLAGRISPWFRSANARTRRSLQSADWALFKKELFLQQVPLLFCLLLLVGWGTMFLTDLFSQHAATFQDSSDSLGKYAAVLGLYFFLVPLISGCISLAEERASGIHSWQITLPVSRRRQWAVKVAGLIFTNAVLGFLVPAALLMLFPALRDHMFAHGAANFELWLWLMGVCAALMLISVYVASLSRNTMQALVAALVTLASAPMLVGALFKADRLIFGAPEYGGDSVWIWAIPAVMLPRLFYLSRRNFGETDMSNRQQARQVVGLVSLLTLVLFVISRLMHEFVF